MIWYSFVLSILHDNISLRLIEWKLNLLQFAEADKKRVIWTFRTQELILSYEKCQVQS